MLPVIIVIIVGIVCIVISVAGMKRTEETDTENNTAEINRITDEYELNEEEIAVLQRRVSDKISGDVEEILYNADQSLSTMSNEKMMALGDYAVTVCDEIEKNHKEVMFLYSMLTDKEKELKALVSEAEARSAELKKANELAIEHMQRQSHSYSRKKNSASRKRQSLKNWQKCRYSRRIIRMILSWNETKRNEYYGDCQRAWPWCG